MRVRLLVVAFAVAASGCCVGAGEAAAAVVFDGSPGTSAPPATLGPATMTAFSADPALAGTVTTTPGPTGTITYDQPVTHGKVGSSWGSWSNGYTGDVYDTLSQTNQVTRTMALPPSTYAFYFYMEQGAYNTVDLTATASDGTTSVSSGPVSTNGNAGARYFGFYSTTPGETLKSISVAAPPAAGGFAVGEFGISNTAPPTPPPPTPVAPVLPSGITLADKTKPTVGALSFSSAVFEAAKSGASTAKHNVKVGTKVSFNVSEASSVKFTVQRKTKGRKVGKKCKTATHSNRKKKACMLWKPVKGSFTVKGGRGKNTFKFRGRVGGKTLKPGSYRLNATATDPAKNKSVPKQKGFRVVK
jgi:hypothetical protein